MARKALVFIISAMFLGSSAAFAQETQDSLLNFLQQTAKNVIVVQDFDDPEGGMQNITWELSPSVYTTRTDEKPYPEKGFIAGRPGRLDTTLIKEDDASMRVLALRTAFNKKGYNYLELVPYDNRETPLETSADGSPVAGLYFDAPILDFGLYIWGSNRDYTLEATFEAPNGTTFTVPLGSLKFRGWKLLTATIPAKYYKENDLNSLRGSKFALKLLKIVLWTKPTERVDDFVVYIDTMYITRAFTRLSYDGDTLGNIDTVNSIEWESAPAPGAGAAAGQQTQNQNATPAAGQ